MKLIVGLGNPGAQYAGTRHNVGFCVAEMLCERWQFGNWKEKFSGLIAEGQALGGRVALLRPMTYMNRSGDSVQSVANFYRIPAEEILVGHDELDFVPGVVKLKQGGGAAGNNGIRDVIAAMGDAFWRIRIGVGKPPGTGRDHLDGEL